MSPSLVHLPIAFVAGVVSFLSPCVLPLIPGYISLISGLSFQDLTNAADPRSVTKKAVGHSFLFVLGFSLVFTLLGAFASGLGGPLSAHLPWLRKVAAALIILFGLHTMGALPIQWLYYQKSIPLSRFKPGPAGAFAMGAAFAFGWTPCVGPILAGVLALATESSSALTGMILLFAYSLGIGIPFILTAAGVGTFLKFFQTYKRFIRWGEIAAGGLLVIVGVLLWTNRFTALANLFSFFNRFVL